jgi:hypothetical protein
MSEPARKIESEFIRIALGDYYVGFTPDVEVSLNELGLDLNDLDDALLDCVAVWSNKIDARGVFFGVIGTTTEGVVIEFDIWIDSDEGICNLERIALASGATGDAEVGHGHARNKGAEISR